MEVVSRDLSTIPSWVVVDNQIHRKDLAFFPGDGGVTSASARASNGELIRVSFILSALPGTSRLCLHCLENREMCSLDNVAAYGEAVLFRLKIDYEGLLSSNNVIDYFIYWAGPSGSELTLLPRWYMTELEIMAAEEEGSWNRTQRITMGIGGTGLLLTCCEGHSSWLLSSNSMWSSTGIRLWKASSSGSAQTEMEWQKDATIEALYLWAMEGYDIQLPASSILY